MSAGWGRFQEEGAGPDWLAAAGEDAGPEWAAPSGAEEPAPGWAAGPGETAASAGTRSGAGQGDAAPGWAAPGESGDGAPGWAAVAESGGDAGPSGWAALADAAAAGSRGSAAKQRSESSRGFGENRQGSSGSRGFGEDRRGGSAAAKKTAAKKSSSGWSSRRKDRDPADADKPKPQPSREKLEQQAKNILLYHLGRQMQTRSQLATRLRKKEIPDDIAEAVLDRFEELHLLDDAAYAETFVRSRHSERGLAKRALGYELRKRGVDDETAAEALEAVDEDQEATTARRLVDSRLRATRGLDPQVRTRRLVGMLARKGYSSSVAFRAVKEALAEEGQEIEFEDPSFD